MITVTCSHLGHGCARARTSCPCCPAKLCHIGLHGLQLTVQPRRELLHTDAELVVPTSCHRPLTLKLFLS